MDCNNISQGSLSSAPSSFRGCPVLAASVMCRWVQPMRACHPLLGAAANGKAFRGRQTGAGTSVTTQLHQCQWYPESVTGVAVGLGGL